MKKKFMTALAVLAAGIVLLPCCKKDNTKPEPEPEPENVAVESVKIDYEGEEIKLFTSTSYSLSATVEPQNATDKTLTWSVDDPEVAAIDKYGNISALKEGNAVITVSAGEKNATLKICVYQAEFSLSSLTMFVEQEQAIESYYVGSPYPFDNFDLYSSDPSVVSVNSKKLVAVSEGSAVITAKFNSGVSGPKVQTEPNMSIEVTVKDPFVADVTDFFSITDKGQVLTVSITSGTVHVGDKVRLLQPTDANGNYIVNVNQMEMYRKSIESATKGDEPSIRIGDQVDKSKLQKGAVLMAEDAADFIVPATKIYGSAHVTKRTALNASAQFGSHGYDVTGTFTYMDEYSELTPSQTYTSVEVTIAEGYKLICNKGQKIVFRDGGTEIGWIIVKDYDVADVKYEDVSQ